MSYTIRNLKPTDYENLAKINTDGLGYEYPVEKTKLRLEENLNAYKSILIGVVDDDDNLVGYIHGEWYVTTYMDGMYAQVALATT